MNVILAKDEEITSSEKFTSNLILSWLKSDFSLTNKRIVGYQPNTLFGILPLGKDEVSYPLKQISSVGVSTKFHLRKFLIGFILVIVGLSFMGDSLLRGLLFLGIGLFPLLNSLTTRIVVTNNAGQPLGIELSILEKKKVELFVTKVVNGISDIS